MANVTTNHSMRTLYTTRPNPTYMLCYPAMLMWHYVSYICVRRHHGSCRKLCSMFGQHIFSRSNGVGLSTVDCTRGVRSGLLANGDWATHIGCFQTVDKRTPPKAVLSLRITRSRPVLYVVSTSAMLHGDSPQRLKV
jgi:hypothetical protein